MNNQTKLDNKQTILQSTQFCVRPVSRQDAEVNEECDTTRHLHEIVQCITPILCIHIYYSEEPWSIVRSMEG